MWTDDQLAELERREWQAAGGTVTNSEDLYRLARIGLAAEKVQMELWTVTEQANYELPIRDKVNKVWAFLKHPSWLTVVA